MTHAESIAFQLGRRRYRQGHACVPNPYGMHERLVAAFEAGYAYEKATHPRPLFPALDPYWVRR